MQPPTLLSALSALLMLTTPSVHASVTDEFVGKGYIYVLNHDNLASATPADRIGCLNERGALSVNSCAVFTRLDAPPYTLSTNAGNCTFDNRNTPANRESIYGENSYAWSCREDNADAKVQRANYYTVVSISAPGSSPLTHKDGVTD